MNFKKSLLAFGLAAASTFAAQYEAEDATLTGTAMGTSTEASGGKYVKMNAGSLSFNVTVASAGNYTVRVHYMNNYGGSKINNLEANGASAAVTFEETEKGKFADVETVLKLNAGANKIDIAKSWGYIDVDYISVEPYEAKKFTLCNAPVTAKATPSAVKLYNFLTNNFGKKTISGIMTGNMDGYTKGDFTKHEDVQAVYKAGGKYPALVGIDLMNATGGNAESGWFQEYTEKAVDIAKSVWEKGGIPAITWHWRPGEETEFYVKGANSSGSYTDFDFTQAFVKGTTNWDTLSTEYKAITGDIDKVAKIFLELQDAGVAAVFRPLHESGGAWFWWSTHTGKQFAALYQLLYERLVFKNGVNNLIWDFNPQDASKISWTPGETYYDVLSVDIYNKANDHQSNAAAFIDFTNKGGTNKVITLSENGPIPDVKLMYEDGAPWSWWMPWYESWSGGFVSQTAASVWQSNLADERIITLDKMPGWASYNEASVGTQTCPTSKENAAFGADTSKANEEVKDLAMGVTYKTLGKDGANIEYQKVPNLTGAKTIAVDITNNGSGGADNGIWVGLAFVRRGEGATGWTWEMSPTTSCWINDGAKATCEFDITKYEDEDGVEHATDLDNLFSVTLMVAAVGFEGQVVFDNMVADNGKVISSFDTKTQLFAAATQSKTDIAKIELVNPDGTSGIKIAPTASAGKLMIAGNNIMFNTHVAGNANVDVFSVIGQRIATLHKGPLSAGAHSFNMAGLNKGIYFVKVRGQGINATQKVIIK